MAPKCNCRSCRPEIRDCTFVPIALGTSRYEVLEALGDAIADVVQALGERVLLIASSDMNHYENDTITRVKDHKAIERILVMDARGLFDVVMNEDISMCGFGPTVAMLTAAQAAGRNRHGTGQVRHFGRCFGRS